MLVILVLTRRMKDTPAEEGARLDLVGTTLSALGLGAIVLGMWELLRERAAWPRDDLLSSLAAGDDLWISPGEVRRAFLGAANRDPDAFSDPDRLRIDRQEARHLAVVR